MCDSLTLRLACVQLVLEFYTGEEDVRSLTIAICGSDEEKYAKVVGTRKYLDEDLECKRETFDLLWGSNARSEEMALQNLYQAMQAAVERAEKLQHRVNGFCKLFDLIAWPCNS